MLAASSGDPQVANIRMAKRGNIVQEQTARIEPDTEATRYDNHFFALTPKYFITADWLMNTAITPAIKKADIR